MPEQKKAVVPRLRFPEFRDAGPWEVKKIGDLFSITRGKVLPMNLISDSPSLEKPYPVYSSQTKNNGLAGYYSEYLFENAITWTTDGANAGDVNYRKGKFYCTNVCGVLLSDEGYANTFVAELLNTFTRKHVSYVGNPKLMNGVMAQIEIPIPHLPEQQKIAGCLSSLDELIELEAKKLEALQAHKKGLMQQLFPREGETTPRLRFPEFRNAGPWEVKQINQISQNVITGGTPSTTVKEYWGGSIRWMNSGDLNLKRVYEVKGRITEIGLRNSSTKIIPPHCVLVGLAGQGKTRGTVAMNMVDLCINQSIAAIFPNDHVFYSDYLYHNLDSRYDELRDLSAGDGGRGGINLQMLKSFLVPLPSLPEQQKIADCLSSLDEMIELEAKKLEALQAHKKGLMQQLFPNYDL